MSNIDNIIIEHLKAIRADVSEIKTDINELKMRVANVESGMGSMMQHIGHQASVSAQQQISYDRIVERIQKLERRLEITN